MESRIDDKKNTTADETNLGELDLLRREVDELSQVTAGHTVELESLREQVGELEVAHRVAVISPSNEQLRKWAANSEVPEHLIEESTERPW